ncbi:MAG: hypothetical protein R6U63_04230 [Longimicrobiales bacterium]
MKTNRILPLGLVWLLAVGACSDFSTAPTRVPASFEMTPDSVLVSQGETVTYEYTVLDGDGEPYDGLPGWASPAWTYSVDSVLTVDPTGVASAIGSGEVVGTATLNGMQAQTVVRVNPSELRVDVVFAHINQASQTRAGAVPLVAGRGGLLRVYLRGSKPNFFQPRVVATFYRDGAAVHTVELTHEAEGLPGVLREEDLSLSFDAPIPGSVLRPGTSVAFEVDPDGIIPASPGSTLRYPETGERPLDIVEVPPFRMRLVPVTQSQNGLESRFSVDNAAEATELTATVFPLSEFDVDVRQPYTTDVALDTEVGWEQLIDEIATLRLDDGSPRYYYGGFARPPGTSYLGLGFVGYPVAIGVDGSPETLAHEIGHTLNLRHAPCGNPSGVDANYPYPGGYIGQLGYDPRTGGLNLPAQQFDLMTYCDPAWISDYNYELVMAYRQTSRYDSAFWAPDAEPSSEGSLIVNVGVSRGVLRLGPVVESEAAPALPAPGGPYTLEGLDETGAVVFSLPFTPRPLDHGGALFSAALPRSLAQPERLATLRVTGPEGVLERGRAVSGPPPMTVTEAGTGRQVAGWNAAEYRLAVVRDRATGRIVAMARGGEIPLPGDPSELDVTLSDGVRSHPVELRQR